MGAQITPTGGGAVVGWTQFAGAVLQVSHPDDGTFPVAGRDYPGDIVNAEELKELSLDLLEDLDGTGRIERLAQLENALAQSIQQPAEPTYQAQTNEARVALLDEL